MKPYKVVLLGNAERGAKTTLAKLTEIYGYHMEGGSISEATSVDVIPPSFFRKHKYANFNYDLAKSTGYTNTADPYPKRDLTEFESFAKTVFREPVETPKPTIQSLDETTVELAKHINELGDRLGELDNASAKWESPANKLANKTSLLADQAAYKEEITDIQSTLADVKARVDRYKATFTQNTFLTLLKSRAGDT